MNALHVIFNCTSPNGSIAYLDSKLAHTRTHKRCTAADYHVRLLIDHFILLPSACKHAGECLHYRLYHIYEVGAYVQNEIA